MAHYFTNDENLKSDIKRVDVTINDVNFYFYTDNGVFSKGELDFGTELLLKTFDYSFAQEKRVLDIGCGCGPIGIYTSKLGFAVDMSDVNERAVNLSRNAVLEQKLNAQVFISDAYENINNKYNYIISNPPIRVGKTKLYEIVMNAKDYLTSDGELWIVVRKKQGADSIIKDMKMIYNNVCIVKKKKGFYIVKAS